MTAQCFQANETDELDEFQLRVLTLLPCANAGLLISLHVHHDPALPVALGVNWYLIACKKNKQRKQQQLRPSLSDTTQLP